MRTSVAQDGRVTEIRMPEDSSARAEVSKRINVLQHWELRGENLPTVAKGYLKVAKVFAGCGMDAERDYFMMLAADVSEKEAKRLFDAIISAVSVGDIGWPEEVARRRLLIHDIMVLYAVSIAAHSVIGEQEFAAWSRIYLADSHRAHARRIVSDALLPVSAKGYAVKMAVMAAIRTGDPDLSSAVMKELLQPPTTGMKAWTAFLDELNPFVSGRLERMLRKQ